MIKTYLQARRNLAAVVLLFDIRRTPHGEDLQLLDWLEELDIPTIPVVTKSDKVNRSQQQKHLKIISEATGLPVDAFTLFSALKRQGMDDVWELIESTLESAEE